ncbi:hypothetical protein EDD86DRAFT_197323 [Gorgonomyces haynaldii]|nr:hypothetical protein EDD86DRAFT_197323 [Gorgonomyces haynaldii]
MNKSFFSLQGDKKTGTPKSKALIYDFQLKERFLMYPERPKFERAQLCFEILEELTEQAGAYRDTLKIITDELKASVFSPGLTTEEDGKLSNIPYFVHIKRLEKARITNTQKIQDSMEEIMQKLKFRDQDLNIFNRKNLMLKQQLLELEETVQSQKERILTLEHDLRKATAHEMNAEKQQKEATAALQEELERVQSSLNHANQIIEKLTMFKDTEKEEGHQKSTEQIEEKETKKDLKINAGSLMAFDMSQCELLEIQFEEMFNLQLDDFESSLSQLMRKREIFSVVEGTEQQTAREQFDKEMTRLGDNFRNRMLRLLDENALLTRHKTSMKLTSDAFEVNKVLPSIETIGDINLRQYAAVMMTGQGDQFEAFEKVGHCTICGGRTIVCPHRILPSTVIQLPPGTTHLKLQHPKLSLRTNFDLETFAKLFPEREKELKRSLEQTEYENQNVSISFFRIWGDYYNTRGARKPRTNRPYNIMKIMKLIDEVYQYRMKKETYPDDLDLDAQKPEAFADTFYELLLEYYKIPVVMLKAAHDILFAMEQEERSNQIVFIFCRHLSGHDEIIWKYIYLARELVHKMVPNDHMDMEQYRKLIEIMYPARTVEIYEHMELEFKAFCKNKIFRAKVLEHLIHMVAKDIEPNIDFFQKCLVRFDTTKKGSLSFEDYDEAITQIMPTASIRERRLLFKQALLHFKIQELPLERVARIAAYILIKTCCEQSWQPTQISPDFALSNNAE